MTVKELIIALLECDMDAKVELEVRTDQYNSYSVCDGEIKVSDLGTFVSISEEE